MRLAPANIQFGAHVGELLGDVAIRTWTCSLRAILTGTTSARPVLSKKSAQREMRAVEMRISHLHPAASPQHHPRLPQVVSISRHSGFASSGSFHLPPP